MRLISFTRLGEIGFGALVDGGVVDLTNQLDYGVDTIKSALESDLLEFIGDYVEDRSPNFSMSDVTLLPVIPNPAKIICIGLNYENHRKETQRPDVAYPTIFVRYPDSQVAHGQALIKPKSTERFDY